MIVERRVEYYRIWINQEDTVYLAQRLDGVTFHRFTTLMNRSTHGDLNRGNSDPLTRTQNLNKTEQRGDNSLNS